MHDGPAPDTSGVLVVSGIEHRVSPTFRLGPVDLTVAAGEGVAVIGTNGAGKSTLIRLIAGLLRPERGDVRVRGVSARRWGRASRHIGYVQQAKELPDGVTVETYLKHQLKLRRAGAERYAELVDLADLRQFEHQYVRKLSGGSQRKLHIISAVAHRPDLLILDEPTAGLDPTAQVTLLEFLGELKKEGVGIVFASHHRDELTALADSLVALHQGRQVEDVSLAAITRAHGGTVLVLEPFDTAESERLASWASELPGHEPAIRSVRTDDAEVRLELADGEHPAALGLLVSRAHEHGFTLRAATYRQPGLADIVGAITNAEPEKRP